LVEANGNFGARSIHCCGITVTSSSHYYQRMMRRVSVPAVASTTQEDQHANDLVALADGIRRAGAMTLHSIEGGLNAQGIRTACGGQCYSTTVSKLVMRADRAIILKMHALRKGVQTLSRFAQWTPRAKRKRQPGYPEWEPAHDQHGRGSENPRPCFSKG
jgi:hypothetical protein